jgi:hypothetical protein
MEGWAGLWPHGMEEKVEFSCPDSALACRARLPCTLRRDLCCCEASRAIASSSGWAEFENVPRTHSRHGSCTHSQLWPARI